MNAKPMFDLKEATRLTQAGRLGEASDLIRRMLGGEKPTPAEPGSTEVKESKSRPGILDMLPPTAGKGAWTAPPDGAKSKLFFEGLKRGSSLGSGIKAPEGLRDLLGRMGPIGSGLGTGTAWATPKHAAPALPDGALFLERTFANGAGSRSYKVYVPSRYNGAAVPLVVMLHGCTQSPDDFAAGTNMNALAEEHSCLVVYPAQSAAANPSKCWNWFSPGDQRRDGGEPSLIAGITRQVMKDYAVDPGRVYVAGLSAGGAAAAIMGSAYPDLFAAIGVHSGLACGAASDMPSAFLAMRQGGRLASSASRDPAAGVPTIVFHGDQDGTVHPSNGVQVASAAGGPDLLRTLAKGTSAGGMGYTQNVQSDPSGRPVVEEWVLHGCGHAWSGGSAAGSYTQPNGPDASREMLRFFLEQRLIGAAS